MTTTVSENTALAAIASHHRENSTKNPRNLWSKLASATHHLARGDAAAAQEVLEGVKFHERLPAEFLARLHRETCSSRPSDEGLPPVNTPSDYLRLPHTLALHSFRRLNASGEHIGRYPRGMPLPALPGAGNDTGFLFDAATCRSAVFGTTSRRMHAVISGATAEQARQLVDRLAWQKGGRQLSVTLFLPAGEVRISPLPDVPVEQVAASILDPSARAVIRGLESRGDDILLFLEGGVVLDEAFLERAAFLSEVTDNLVQVLRPVARRDELTSTFSRSGASAFRKDPRPYDCIQGFNFVVSARLLRRVGGLESRFEAAGLAAREIGYRMHFFGGYFHTLPVPDMGTALVGATTVRDIALFDSLCPRPGIPREGQSFDRPRVSVYIPAYNAERFIVQAVESVLRQDVPDVEVCVFDDGSSDATCNLLEKRFAGDDRVVLAGGRNGGIGYASNGAVRLTRAPYVAQLDSDDLLKPGVLRRLMEYLDRNPDLACCYGSCERINDRGEVIAPEYSWPNFSREKMMITSIVHHPRMFRRSAWERTSGFREDLVNAVDYDMFLKLSEVGDLHHVDQNFYQRRWHDGNTSLVNEHAQTKNTWRVQQAALERQSLSRDWQVSVGNSAEPRKITYKRRSNRRCVVFWPDYSRSNPYQKLLYRSARTTHDVVGGNIESALSIIGEFEFKSMVTFHLHWLNFVLAGATTQQEAESAARDFVLQLKKFKTLGGKIVWTVHNAVSHDSKFEDVELRLSEEVAEIADILHFHSSSSIEEVASTFAFRSEKAVISRHGSFVGAYPDFIDRRCARRELGLAPGADVLLFLGQIRSYKGIDHLLEAFRALSRNRPNATLLIAGEDKSGLLPSLLKGLSKEDRARVRTTARRIDDFEMQVFFRAADLAILPYKRILTSGSLLLAMGFGVPAVVPNIGMCREVIGEQKAGFLFSPDTGVSGLLRAIEEGLSLKDRDELQAVSQNARARAELLKWPNFARVFEAWRIS